MGRFSKFFGGVIGSFVGIGVAGLAYAGLATCQDAPVIDVATCTVMGFTPAQITATAMLLFSNLGVFFAPANS